MLSINFVERKIEKLGIQGYLNQWIKYFLSDRLLGPIILIFFIMIQQHSIALILAKILLYADDIFIIINEIERLRSKLNSVLKQLCIKNRLVINQLKTFSIEFLH